MKIKALSRSDASTANGSSQRNFDPALHPFHKAREYVRALNAAKMDRMFAAPFVGQLGRGHVDGVYCMAKDPETDSVLASGSGDGVVKVWDLASREEIFQAKAHENIVHGVTWARIQGQRYVASCGSDSRIELFDPSSSGKTPKLSILGDAPFTSISHHREHASVAASLAAKINVYDLTRTSSKPTQTIAWPDGISTITACRFNQTETSILASCAVDRSLVLYDVRTSSSLHRTTLTFACNSIAWNPQEAFNFATGSEDHNIYQWDMRHMRRALNVQKGHVAAVMSVDFSPTGQALVSGSYDRTIRIFDRGAGSSRDVYHTKRQQRVFSVSWSGDNNFVLSGSDDGNIRVWRAVASSRQGVKSFAQRQKLEYDDKLKERYGHMPEIKRILRHRHLPKTVKKAGEIKNEELKSLKRRAENERRHTKKQTLKRKPEREKMVLGHSE